MHCLYTYVHRHVSVLHTHICIHLCVYTCTCSQGPRTEHWMLGSGLVVEAGDVTISDSRQNLMERIG